MKALFLSMLFNLILINLINGQELTNYSNEPYGKWYLDKEINDTLIFDRTSRLYNINIKYLEDQFDICLE